MQPRQAATILSVPILSTTTEEEVKALANDAIRAAHPDNGGDPSLASVQIARAKLARDVLLKHLASDAPLGRRECPVCDGVGQMKVRGAFKARDCPRCRGEGTVAL